MKQVAYITDEMYLEHDTGVGHPECRERLFAIERAITPLKERMVLTESISVSEEMLRLVHSQAQISQVEACSRGAFSIDSDTVCSEASYEVAKRAVGAGITAIDGIKEGQFERAFCAVRPPGHHATPERSMGFCLFNNIAIAARYAQQQGYEKVMIIDFDVHHGNGTQDIFWRDEYVFYLSTHQSYTYPGTGGVKEIGEGRGRGYTRNFPLEAGSGDNAILKVYQENVPTLVNRFAPDIILVSAGYDLHQSDPLASLQVTTEGIRNMVRTILDYRDVPYLFFLEGGYNITALGESVKVTVEEMLI